MTILLMKPLICIEYILGIFRYQIIKDMKYANTINLIIRIHDTIMSYSYLLTFTCTILSIIISYRDHNEIDEIFIASHILGIFSNLILILPITSIFVDHKESIQHVSILREIDSILNVSFIAKINMSYGKKKTGLG